MRYLSRIGIHVKHPTIILLTIVLLVAALLSGLDTLKRQLLRSEAETVAGQVVSFRDWVAMRGAVWVDHLVEETEDFLGERQVEGGSFYSKNPALATRELSEIVSKSALHATFRVTSDNYRNAKNLPDEFERQALQDLQAGGAKSYAESFENGTYRYAKPILITKDCLQCHGDPKNAPPDVLSKYGPDKAFGYKEGDIRGIISVRLPDVSCWEIMRTFVNPCSVVLVLCAVALNIFYTRRLLSRSPQDLAETGE